MWAKAKPKATVGWDTVLCAYVLGLAPYPDTGGRASMYQVPFTIDANQVSFISHVRISRHALGISCPQSQM